MNIVSFNRNSQSYKANYLQLQSIVNGHSSQYTYHIHNYYTLGVQINSIVNSIKSTLMTILFFLFILSGLLIVNTMFFSVKERINEIGIRKAIGAFDCDIVKQFVFEGFIYGVISACIGIIIGISLASNIYYFLELNKEWNVHLMISLETVIICIMLPIIVGTAASLPPAIYASRIKITDAMKSE